jgi:hypothetical protein
MLSSLHIRSQLTRRGADAPQEQSAAALAQEAAKLAAAQTDLELLRAAVAEAGEVRHLHALGCCTFPPIEALTSPIAHATMTSDHHARRPYVGCMP